MARKTPCNVPLEDVEFAQLAQETRPKRCGRRSVGREKRWQETEDTIAKIMEVAGVLGGLGLGVSVCLWNDFGRQF